MPRKLMPLGGHRRLTSRPEQSRCKVVQVAAPCLPLVRRARRLPKDVLNLRFIERRMQLLNSLLHPFGLVRPHSNPQQMDALGKRGWISHRSVERRLRVEFVVSHGKDIGRSAESADVGEQFEM